MGFFADIWGTTKSTFQIALGGVQLKNSSGTLQVRNAGDSAYAAITASQLNNTGEAIVLNSDAPNSGADWTLTIQRPASGQAAALTFTLPPNYGSSGQVLQTDGSGTLTWAAAGTTSSCVTCNETVIAYGDSSPVTMMTLPENAFIEKVVVIVDTAFNGTTPALSVGISGTTSKYLATTDVDLATAGMYVSHPGTAVSGSSESIIATLSAGSSSAGSARVQVYYSVPA